MSGDDGDSGRASAKAGSGQSGVPSSVVQSSTGTVAPGFGQMNVPLRPFTSVQQ